MKTLKAFCTNNSLLKAIPKLQSILNERQKHALEFSLWKHGNEYKPEVSFSLSYTDHSVLLKFFVEEKEIRANVTKINGPVWEDSCVEFFVSFDESGYYNFECNCLGTVLGAFGKSRNAREFLPEKMLKEIETHTKLSKKNDHFSWEILILIPVETFIHHSLKSLKGTVAKGNFYKCGDGLSQPHYLSWSNILSDRPDFHLPDFFGTIRFE